MKGREPFVPIMTTVLPRTSASATSADVRAGGSDGLYALTAATVADDGAADRLYGNQGQDWFWSYLFDVNDEHGNETNR